MPYYGLFLNMMRDRAERVDLVATARTPEALINWMDSQRADENYSDGSTSAWGNPLHKTFKSGTRLEYYNPPPSTTVGETSSFGEGIVAIPDRDDHMAQAGIEWDAYVGSKLID